MDFRRYDPRVVTWKRGNRGNVVATIGNAKLTIQTPRCECRTSVHSPGTFRVELRLDPHDALHRSFAAWLEELERAASGPWKNGLEISPCVYNDTMRLLVFSDTLAFDDRGELSADIMSARGCSAIVEIAGAWISGDRWGVRLKVDQIKFTTEFAYPCMFVDDD